VFRKRHPEVTVSFTLDGHTIETEPITMLHTTGCPGFECYINVPGHLIEVGDWLTCDEHDAQVQVVGLVRTEIVPTVHI
jgi:hypothetical protein